MERMPIVAKHINDIKRKVLVEIEGIPIEKADVDFEYQLLTRDLQSMSQDLTSIPALGKAIEVEGYTLRDQIMSGISERKILFQMIKRDKSFNLSDSGRYVDCLKQWMRTVKHGDPILNAGINKERLKSRLCEQSILQQYLEENIFKNIRIKADEVLEYFRNHPKEFERPSMVSIRQIVLADERQARKIRNQVTRKNFIRLAKKYSITPEAQEGGLLEPFPIGYGMPRFFEVAFSMRPGEISNILKSTYGFHLILLEKKWKIRKYNLSESLERIRAKLLQKEKERAYQKWIDLALHTIKVSIPKVYW